MNYIQTEENQTGEGHLLHALGWLLQRFHSSLLQQIISFKSMALHYATELSSLSGTTVTHDNNTGTNINTNVDLNTSESKTDGIILSSSRPSPIGGLYYNDFVGLACITLECLNYLALIYSGWDNHPRSLKCLRLGKTVYRRIRAFQNTIHERQQSQSTTQSDNEAVQNTTLLYESPNVSSSQESSLNPPSNLDILSSELSSSQPSYLLNAHHHSLATLDNLYTHLLFYYAQIYGHLHVPTIAAYYVERTLSRQLAEQTYNETKSVSSSTIVDKEQLKETDAMNDKLEWVRNVLRLIEYHVGRKNWRAAAICGYAAEAMLGTVLANYGKVENNNTADATASVTITIDVPKLPENVQRLLAESATHWGLIYETMLRIARDRDFAKANSLTDTSTDDKSSSEMDEDGTDPFSTGALINFGKYQQQDGISSIRGDGDDMINIDDSDHEAEVDLVVTRLNRLRDKEPTKVTYGGPLAEFITRIRPKYKPYIISYGPSRLGDDLLCPGSTFASSLVDLPDPSRITTFEQARDVFKGGLAAFTRAKEYFLLDGFVTEYIGIQTGISRIYKYLAFYENDDKRNAAMHGRRVAALEPLLKELNSNVYMRYHREISLEVASAWQEIFEIRLNKLELRLNVAEGGTQLPKKAEIDSINEAADGAIRNYSHFIRCYDDPRLPIPVPTDGRNSALVKLSGATSLLEDDLSTAEAYMTAHFCIARMLTRKLSPELTSRISDQKAAFDRFTWIIKAVPKIAPRTSTGSNTFFKAELGMCKEMVTLLPAKIDHLQRRGVDLQAPGRGRV